MKIIRTLFFISLILTLALESTAQTFGVKAGLNLANMLAKDDEGKFDTKMISGINFGVSAEFPITEMFSFETGLQLSGKGTKQTYATTYTEVEGKYKLLYIDIPLTAKARYDLNGIKIYGVLGPYIGIGLSGQRYDSGAGTDVNWGSDSENDDLKRLDFGLLIGGGVEIKSIQIGLTYGLGFANISSYTAYETKISNRVLGLSVGYMFGRK
jgi:opacity protein-like surface antigen